MAGAALQKRTYPTQYEKNGSEVTLLLGKAEKCQRNILHKHFSRDPATFFNQLNEPTTKSIFDGFKEKII